SRLFWLHSQTAIAPADVLIVITRLGIRLGKIPIYLRRNTKIAVGEPITEFDLEGVQMFAVTDRGERAGLHWSALNAGDNWLDRMICGLNRRARNKRGYDQCHHMLSHQTSVSLVTP